MRICLILSNYALDFLHSLNFIILFVALNELRKYREVSEWLKEHAWKACIPLKGIEGSNPFLSAAFQRGVENNVFNSCDKHFGSWNNKRGSTRHLSYQYISLTKGRTKIGVLTEKLSMFESSVLLINHAAKNINVEGLQFDLKKL